MKKLIFLHIPLHSHVKKLWASLCHHFTTSMKKRNTVMSREALNYELTTVWIKHIMNTKSCVSSRGKSHASNYNIYSNARQVFFFKFGAYIYKVILHSRMMRRTGPQKTWSLWTRPCGAKLRPASSNHMRSVLFWDITQHRVVIPYQRFRTVCWPHLQVLRNQEILGFLDPRRWDQ